MKKNVIRFMSVFGIVVAACSPITFFAMEAKNMSAPIQMVNMPIGFMAVLTLVPLVVVLGLIFLKFDMVIAGFVGGVLAMLISGISLDVANTNITEVISQMFMNTELIINAALAGALLQSGGYAAATTLASKVTKIKAEYSGIFCLLLLALTVYFSGSASGSVIIIAPLVFAAVGAVPEFIVALSLVSALFVVISPASLATGVIAYAGGFTPAAYIRDMLPYSLFFVFLALVLAFFGIKRAAKTTKAKKATPEFDKMGNATLVKLALPLTFLLLCVICGSFVNYFAGFALITPVVYMIGTLVLIYLCTSLSANETVTAMINGASYMLARLFQVAIYFGFINIIAATGAFGVIAHLVKIVPRYLTVPTAVIVGCLIAIPAGVYISFVLTLFVPLLAAVGFSPVEIGLAAMGVALSSQINVANITLQALSLGFEEPVRNIVRNNMLWVGLACGLLIALATIIGFI